MFSEYLLGDNFENGRDAGYSRSEGHNDGGCLVIFVTFGSLLTSGLLGLAFAVLYIAF